ncbi:MAG: response regulator transcription factor [Tannerellaceae bacterium]|nr:response regulator transcription factor [Tannerellaceae bacterium]
MGQIKLLMVEDDGDLVYIIGGTLKRLSDYLIYTATNGKEGLDIYRKVHPDIIVADVEMPEMSGFEMVKEIRSTDALTPIIFASARKSPEDFIEGLEIGADNFIRKPYTPDELNMQILTLLKRVKGLSTANQQGKDKYILGNLLFDARLRTLQCNGKSDSIHLSEREANVLKILAKNRDEVVKRDDILTNLWSGKDFYTARSLDVFMTKIRKYLKTDDSIGIQTIRGEGYRLTIGKK